MKQVKISAYQRVNETDKLVSDEMIFEGTLDCADCGKFPLCNSSKFCRPIVGHILERCDSIHNTATVYNRKDDTSSAIIILDNKHGAAFNLARVAMDAIKNCNVR